MSDLEKLQETLECINQNIIIMVQDQQEMYLLLERILDEVKKE
ncbi:hypothetical protein [Caproicibacterium sp. XB1]